MWYPGKDTRSKAGKENAKEESRIHVVFLLKRIIKKTKNSKENVIFVVFVAFFNLLYRHVFRELICSLGIFF